MRHIILFKGYLDGEFKYSGPLDVLFISERSGKLCRSCELENSSNNKKTRCLFQVFAKSNVSKDLYFYSCILSLAVIFILLRSKLWSSLQDCVLNSVFLALFFSSFVFMPSFAT